MKEPNMLTKLFKGELSLAATFWKFGIFGLFVLYYALKISAKFLASYLGKSSILNYFFYEFHFVYSPKMSLWWALCYVSIFIILTIYSYRIIIAVWRCAKNYEKSVWLAWLARLGIVFTVAFIWYPIIMRFM